MGVKIYDLLCGGRNLGKSAALSRDEVLSAVPGLSNDNLTGAVRYFDGFTCDARLVIDTLRSAANNGAKVFNYAALMEGRPSADRWTCQIQDKLSDQISQIDASVVVNATGAWADLLPASRVPLRLTKGSHLVIDRKRLPINDAIVMADGKRILFAIPWGVRVILGTTDTDYQGDRDAPVCDRADAEYILRIANLNFPSAALTFADIKSTWAGLRPLIDGKKSGAPSDISRRHLIEMTEPGWFDVAGGKLTTYRLMAEQTVDRIVTHLKIDAPQSSTATTPLIQPFSRVACDPTSAAHGSHATRLKGSAPSFRGITPPEVAREAVEHFCRKEWALCLDDVMIRRTSWQHYVDDPDAVAGRVSQWMAEVLAWAPGARDDERTRYLGTLARARPWQTSSG